MREGIHTMSADAYHADDVGDEPTLSSSIARTLISKSPAHALWQHPKLSPKLVVNDTDATDTGTIIHQVILEGSANGVHVIDAPDFRTKAAQEERALARSLGRTPILGHKWEAVSDAISAIKSRIHAHEANPPVFQNGEAEQTIVWREQNGVWCRSRIDWLHNTRAHIDDLKTTGKSADPQHLARHIYSMGYDVQAAFYLRGIKHLTGVDATFRFVFCEVEPPYGLSVIELSPAALALAADKVDYAIELWGECLRANKWPCYPTRVATVDPPAWAEVEWMSRNYEEAA